MVNAKTTIYIGSVRKNSVLRPIGVVPYAWGLDREVYFPLGYESADLERPVILYILQGLEL